MSLLTILSLIFIVLKLTHCIDWPWWAVLAPTLLHVVFWLGITLWWETKSPIDKARYIMGRGK